MLARLRTSTEENEGGFTLIELLVVMIIIGILAAIAIPAFLNQKTKAKETAAKSDATSIATDISSSIVDGDLASTGGAVLNAGPPQTITLTFADTTANPAVTITPRVTSGNKIDKVTGAGSTYCVQVQAYQSDGTTKIGNPWKATDAGLSKGTC